MKFIKFAAALGLMILIIIVLDHPKPYGLSLPPVADFFNPFTGFWQNAESPDHVEDGEWELPGLQQAVQVVFDDRLVPHIFAGSTEDAFYAQGYVTAQFRLWQMDIAIRSAGGRLSEVLGEQTLARDKLQRRKGMRWAAERALEAWSKSEDQLRWIEAYTAGVNEYISSLSPADYPLEYKLLNYAPEPWTPLKSALFFKSMAETLASRNDDLQASHALSRFGKDLFDFLYPDYNPRQSPIIPEEIPWEFEPIAPDTIQPLTQMSYGEIPERSIPQPPPFLGSNNWAIAGKKTAGGYPILCNDPHLPLTLPSIWYEVQIHTPEYNAYGVGFPGVPGIIIGFNEHYAWGLTNVGQDILDWYRLTWVDDEKTQYLVDGQAEAVEFRIEEIQVSGLSEPVLDTVAYTRWGPIVYTSPEDDYYDLAMRWIAHDVSNDQPMHEMGTFVALMKGKSLEDYRRALRYFDTPAQNFVFASQDDNIALQVNGKFPVRKPDQGRFIQDGSSSAQAWRAFIPRDQVPFVVNPERGFVASANQRSTGRSYPYYYLGGFDDYRGRLINRVLDTMQMVSIEDMKALQNSNYSLRAEEGTPALLGQLDQTALSEIQQQMLAELSSWDYRFEAGSKAPVVFDNWFRKAYQLTFDEVIAADQEKDMLFPEDWRFIELLQEAPFHEIFDDQQTAEKENARAIVSRAFREVTDELAEEYPSEGFNWGNYKGTFIPHLGRIPGLGTDPLWVGGYADAPNAIQRTTGPSWRMIVQLGPQIKAWGVYPGGQSGNPSSPYYDNMVDAWRQGQYYELWFMRTPDEKPDKATARWEFSK